MRKLLISILTIAMLLTGCATFKPSCSPCPKEDATIKIVTPFRQFYVTIPKGDFDNPDNYMDEKELKDFIDDLKKKESKKGI